MYLIFMGVSGVGKSTYAKRASAAFGSPFFEADEFHPPANVEKMSAGTPLTNQDRVQWLEALCAAVCDHGETSAVISCSALNPFVREILNQKLPGKPVYIWLDASEETIRKRLRARTEHFMPESLLRSQIDALQPPEDAISVTNEGAPDAVFETIRAHLIPLFDEASGQP